MKTQSLFAFALIALTAASALAADGSLSAAPAVVMLTGTAGQTTTQTLTLINNTGHALTFEMIAKDVAIRDGRRVFVEAGDQPNSIAVTAVFSQKSVVAGPGERVSVSVTVTIPPNPPTRAIVALFRSTTTLKVAGMRASASIGTLLTFALSDAATADAGRLEVKQPTSTSNLSVSQKVVNSGSEPLLARGVLAIVNRDGLLVARQDLPPRRILPGEYFDLHAEYGGELATGHYRALVTYDLQNHKALTSSAEFDVR